MSWKALENVPGFRVKKTLTLIHMKLFVLTFNILCLKVINNINAGLKRISMS